MAKGFQIPSAWMTARIADVLPRVVVKRDAIRTVPQRWNAQYPNGRRADISEALNVLDLETCDEADVDRIIGNNSWTRLECDVCGEDREAVVRVQREYDGAIDICGECGAAVLEMLAEKSA